MNVSYRGTVSVMHDTAILDVGIYKAKCGVGSVQHLIFKGGDEGPFWMDKNEQRMIWFQKGQLERRRQMQNAG